MQLAHQSDRKKTPDMHEYRAMTEAEIRALRYGSCPCVILNNGRVGQVKINGEIRTWKRDATRVEIPVKYGMYEYATLSLAEALERFVVAL